MSKVAVLIPAYNRESFIATCLDSIISQTHKDLVIFVYDDGSTDNTSSKVLSIADTRIKLITNSVNNGVVYARNELLKLAKDVGIKYACWQDSDDISFATRVQAQLEYLANNDVPAVYTRWGLLNSNRIMPIDDICNASVLFEVNKAPEFREIKRHPTPTTLGGEDVDWRYRFCEQYGDPRIIDSALYWVLRHNDRISRWRHNPSANPDWYKRMSERVKSE